MKARLFGLASALVLAATVPLTATAQSDSHLKDVVSSTVRILAVDAAGNISQGTGWVVAGPDKDNRAGASVIVTANHVIAGAVKVVVIPSGVAPADLKPSTVIYATAERDIAFIEVKDLNAQPITITRERPDIGDDAVAAGYNATSDKREAASMAKVAAVKSGHISKYFQGPMSDSSQAPVDQVEFDAQILQGYSGGPLVNKCGRAIGLTVKDGGHLALAPDVSIATGQGTDAALAANEIIKAANDARVNLSIADSACPTTTPVITSPTGTPTGGATTVDTTTNWRDKLTKPATLIVVGLIGLAIALGAAFALFRKKPAGMPLDPGPSSRPLSETPLVPVAESIPQIASTVPSIRISGSGPSGEPVEMRFRANELGGSGVVLGVEGDGQARVVDRRPSPHVSRRHARLFHDGQNFLIEDNKSSNGTFVGGQRLEPFKPRVLMNGDHLRLADVALAVSVE